MRNVVSAGDFNFFTATKLEAMGGSPALKKKSVINMIKTREGFEFCNIWRTRNPSSQRYTFRQKHFSVLTERRLDYIFLLNSLKNLFKKLIYYLLFQQINPPLLAPCQNHKILLKGTLFGNVAAR